MTNLKTLNQAVKDKTTLEIAEENAKLEQEREDFKKRHAEELKRLGIEVKEK